MRNSILATRNDMDMFDMLLGNPLKGIETMLDSPSLKMRINLVDNGTSYDYEVALPGYTKEDITIEPVDGCLKLSVTKETSKEENKKYVIKEHTYSNMVRYLKVPVDTSVENITAKFDNGILLITLPKIEKTEKNNFIEIQ